MTITQQKLESLGMNRLRELAHALESACPDAGEVRAKSISELAALALPVLELLETEQRADFDALLAEFELDEAADLEQAPEGDEDRDDADEPGPSGDHPEDDAEDLNAPVGEAEDVAPLATTMAQRKGPFDYVIVEGFGHDPELLYGDLVPDPTADLYEVVPYKELTISEAKRAVNEGASLNVDGRWSHGAHEEWARQVVEKA